jgi:hypothetical protein
VKDFECCNYKERPVLTVADQNRIFFFEFSNQSDQIPGLPLIGFLGLNSDESKSVNV